MAGDSLRDIGTMFGTSKSEVDRHKRVCMKNRVPALTASIPVPAYQTPAEVAIAQQNVRSVAQRAGQLVDKMESLVQRFEDTGDMTNLMKAAKEVGEGLRLLAQLSGELSTGGSAVQVNVNTAPTITPEEMRVYLEVANNHPAMKAELLERLGRLRGVRVIPDEVKS